MEKQNGDPRKGQNGGRSCRTFSSTFSGRPLGRETARKSRGFPGQAGAMHKPVDSISYPVGTLASGTVSATVPAVWGLVWVGILFCLVLLFPLVWTERLSWLWARLLEPSLHSYLRNHVSGPSRRNTVASSNKWVGIWNTFQGVWWIQSEKVYSDCFRSL